MNEQIDRVMIFIELVKGCTNEKCESFGTLCSIDKTEPQFMSEDTLNVIIDDILHNSHIALNRVDIWTYGCGDPLLHPQLDKMAKLLKRLPYKKTIAIDSNCWRENTGWGDLLAPVVLFKEDSFKIDELSEITSKWNANFNGPRFGFILKRLAQEVLDAIREIQSNHGFIKARSFHYVPLGSEINYKTITNYQRPPMVIEAGIEVERMPCPDKKAIRIMYRVDGSLRRCLVSTTEKKSLAEFLEGDLSDCDQCFPYMGGEQLLIFKDKVLLMEKARCVSDKP